MPKFFSPKIFNFGLDGQIVLFGQAGVLVEHVGAVFALDGLEPGESVLLHDHVFCDLVGREG